MKTGGRLICWLALAVALLMGGCRSEAPTPAPAPKTEAIPTAVTAPLPSAPTARAPSASAASASVGRVAGVGEPFLWEVRSPKGPTYLFGTMHIGADAETQLASVVWDKLRASRTFVMEADVSSVSPFEMMKIATLPEGQSLDTQLGAEAWSKVLLATGGALPGAALKRFKPWFVIVTITQQMLPKTEPMDLVFQKRARAADMRLLYLERWQEQVAILDEAMTNALLLETLDELDEVRKRLKEMQQAYLRGDGEAMTRQVFDADEMKKHPKLYELTFFRRNKAWMPQIEARIGEGGAFVAVGVGHLLGDKGIVRTLASKGVDVVRISKSGSAP